MDKISRGRKRCKAFQMLFTEDELQELEAASIDAHLSKAGYIRVKIFDGKEVH